MLTTLRLAIWVSLITHCGFASAAPPATFESVGIGGGGALFSPALSPHSATTMFVACDMSEVFRTTSSGTAWAPVHFTQLQGNRSSQVQFTSDPNTLYTIDHTNEAPRPVRSTDGGITWAPLAVDPTGGECYWISADPASTQRLLVSSYTTVYYSANAGANWSSVLTGNPSGAGCYVGGAYWNGNDIVVGTNLGIHRSTAATPSFSTAAIPQISGRGVISLAGATVGATTRLFVCTAPAASLYAGQMLELDLFGEASPLTLYSLDLGAASWTNRQNIADTHVRTICIGMARNNIDVVYAAGGFDNQDFPSLYKSTNAGAAWSSVLNTTANANIITGWEGTGGDRTFGYGGGIVGLGVAPNDANRAAFSDYGFVHTTANGGTTWRQAYVNQADENPAGSNTPTGKAYHSVGIENTSCWRLTWLDANNLWASFSDIRGIRSTNGGDAWSFNYTGHTLNTSYDCVKHPTNGNVYLATSSAHDIYQTTYLTDARLDGASGQILVSSNIGQAWTVLRNFGDPVIDIALDPNNANTMYASVIHSTNGGVFRTTDLQNGAASTWARLAVPPRTEGHPYNIHVLNDGTLVCTYSGRRTTVFTVSSGVFVSTNGGSSWVDRSSSDARLQYYVKDLVIDPHDANQNTWYVCVWSGYGGPTANNSGGGLYRTTNRGVSWTRINDLYRVSSLTISPTTPGEAYLTTEQEGLWHTTNLAAATPTFTQVASYPFRQPERVYYNPHQQNQVWVTSFGHGIRRGTEAAGMNGDWMLFVK